MKKMFAVILSLAICTLLAAPAYAVIDPYAALEEKSRQAVDAAIRAGTVPEGKTIYDCRYVTGEDGIVRVIAYTDDTGVWIDIATQKPKEEARTDPDGGAGKLEEGQTEEYAGEVFRLINEERREAGLGEVVWDDDFAACARIRAEELQYRYSHYRPFEPEAGSGDWPELSNGKPGFYNCPSVADEQGVAYTWIWENIVAQRRSPEAAVKAWMDSEGHRDNILMESHTRCGVGVFYTEKKSPEGHHWYWVIWFDE